MDFKNILVQSGRRMLDKGLTVETWGNISVRDPQSGLIYLTPSAMPYNTISRDDVVVMTFSQPLCPQAAHSAGNISLTLSCSMSIDSSFSSIPSIIEVTLLETE